MIVQLMVLLMQSIKFIGRLHKQENTFDRLKWLEENNYLPLPEHQAYGSFMLESKKIKDGHNPLTGETKKCL